ncbi:MAG TPA: hypothetical protein VM261_36485 [Kofleriaceae bacterium]|nr:hypothetical protein [Kofleriaceae bacterium]
MNAGLRSLRRAAPVMVLVAAVVASVVVFGFGARAEAQPAEAMGRPLPDPKLIDGTVTMRVVAGDPNKPVSGVEATIMLTPPDGISDTAVRRARTDTDGRVTFTDVPPDTVVMLKAPSEASDSGEVSSSQFPMPAAGGVRVMISTVPIKGAGPMMPGAGGAGGGGRAEGPMAGGGDGPPSGAPMTPRAMSGQGRTENGDPADRMTVRLSYDDFADKTPPAGVPVLVVGYRFDLQVEGKLGKTGPDGRAVFDGLDRRGATTYFAMTLLPRGASDHDRLLSAPMMLPGDHGVRLVLSGDKRDVTAPVDDLGKIDPQPEGGVPGGEIQVALAGLVEAGDPVELVDALTGKLLTSTKAGPPVPNPASVGATWDGVDDPILAIGALVLNVDANQTRAAGAQVEIVAKPAAPQTPATAATPGTPAAPPWTGSADANGEIKLTGLPVGVDLEVTLTVQGMKVPARTVKLPAAGGRREQARVTWQTRGQGAARFTNVPGGPERAYFVRAYLRGQPCLSAPFQLTATRGAGATVLVFPRILFGFSLRASIHDVYLGARGTFTIRNSSLAPFIPGTIGKPEELVIPLPKGFIGGTVDPQFAEQVGIDATRGFIVREPVPPGGMGFVGHFSLKTDEGSVTWDLDLPYGTLESGMEIKRTKDMTLDLGPKMPVQEATDERGSWYVLSPISVQPKQRMVFTVNGLPQPPAWTRWSRDIVGLVVLAIVLAAIALAVFLRPKAKTVSTTRYDELIEELATLGEASDPAVTEKREQLLTELETLHRARAHGGAA